MQTQNILTANISTFYLMVETKSTVLMTLEKTIINA